MKTKKKNEEKLKQFIREKNGILLTKPNNKSDRNNCDKSRSSKRI
jgi:hypothetical protein